ncbi:hypothetical protein AAVH_19792 [Aphelenchoides avenae]|nr:hypothetical protein AAVH_19792 [Aphelenchus avenae]
MSDSDSDIAAANHRNSRTYRAPADDDVNSDDMAVIDKRRSAPNPTHSVGELAKKKKPRAKKTSAKKNLNRDSSSSSASSPNRLVRHQSQRQQRKRYHSSQRTLYLTWNTHRSEVQTPALQRKNPPCPRPSDTCPTTCSAH